MSIESRTHQKLSGVSALESLAYFIGLHFEFATTQNERDG